MHRRPPTLAQRLEQVFNLLRELLEGQETMAKTQADLDVAIAGLPQQIEDAVDAALKPVIAAIEAKATPAAVDFSAEVDALNALGATVAGKVAADLSPADKPADPAPAATPGA